MQPPEMTDEGRGECLRALAASPRGLQLTWGSGSFFICPACFPAQFGAGLSYEAVHGSCDPGP